MVKKWSNGGQGVGRTNGVRFEMKQDGLVRLPSALPFPGFLAHSPKQGSYKERGEGKGVEGTGMRKGGETMGRESERGREGERERGKSDT